VRGLFGRLFGAGRAAAEAEPSPLVALARRLEETEKRPLLRIPTEGLGQDARRVAGLLNARLDSLAAAEKEQQQFIADVSHELRTPLTVLRGSLEVALEEERPAEEYREAIGSAILEVRHLTRISQNLLFLTRGESGRVTLSFSNLDVGRFASEVVKDLAIAAADRGLELTAEIPTLPVFVFADSGRLQQVLHNLIENSLRYTEPGGKIRVAVTTAPGEARISVADTGLGIPEADLPLVFERFYRTKRSRAANPGGSGLGLSIVRWIVEAHKGSVSVESVVGEGSTFTVHLPVI
jgi:signal transduction histidine kinase